MSLTKEKPYAVLAGEGGTIYYSYTLEEAKAVASEQAHKTKSRALILKVVSTIAPKYDTVEETW